MSCSYVPCKLTRRLVALIAMGALERLLPNMNSLVKVQLVFVFEALFAEPADVRLAFHMNQLVKPQ